MDADDVGTSWPDHLARAVGATRIVSVSNPQPVVRDHNVVGLFDTAEQGRAAVVSLESMEADDAAIGLTVLSTDPFAAVDGRAAPVGEGVDPEGVAGEIAPRAFAGIALGALLGALVVGLVAGLIAGPGAALGGALGGAVFGAGIGAVWGAFSRMGGSDAYRQTFVADDDVIAVVSLHTDDPARVDEAVTRLRAASPSDVLLLDPHEHGFRRPAR